MDTDLGPTAFWPEALFTDKVRAGGGNDIIRVVASPAPPWLIMVDCGPGEDTVIWLEGKAFESPGCKRVLTL